MHATHHIATSVTLNMRRALSAALTGLALAAITQVSYAAGDVASQTQIAILTEAPPPASASAIAEPRRSGSSEQHGWDKNPDGKRTL